MKKFAVYLILLLVLFVSAVPAQAAGGNSSMNAHRAGYGVGRAGNPPFALAGTIAGLDAEAKTVTLTVYCGNPLIKQFTGQDLVIQTNDATRFLLRNPGSYATPITFDDLAVGQKVSAHGQYTNNTWMAGRITVGAELNCLP